MRESASWEVPPGGGPLKERVAASGRPRLLDQVRLVVHARHYSPRTERAYYDSGALGASGREHDGGAGTC